MLLGIAIGSAVFALISVFHAGVHQHRLDAKWSSFGANVFFDDRGKPEMLVGHGCWGVVSCASGFQPDSLRVISRELPELEILVLSGTPVSNDDLSHIAGLRSLRSLGLNDTRIDDNGLSHLVSLRMIEYLHLAGTPITDESVSYLEQMDSLVELDLRRTSITPRGIDELRSKLPDAVLHIDMEDTNDTTRPP